MTYQILSSPTRPLAAAFYAAALYAAIAALTSPALSEESKSKQTIEAPKGILYSLDFSGNQGKNASEWFKANGFRLEKDADNAALLSFSFNANALVIETKKHAMAFAIREAPDVPARRIRITWGVEKYPVGASWEKGLNREPVMIYVFLRERKAQQRQSHHAEKPILHRTVPLRHSPCQQNLRRQHLQALWQIRLHRQPKARGDGDVGVQLGHRVQVIVQKRHYTRSVRLQSGGRHLRDDRWNS